MRICIKIEWVYRDIGSRDVEYSGLVQTKCGEEK